VLDAMMPGLSGFDVCSKIKNDDNLKDIKVIIFSNQDKTVLNAEGKKAGADEILSKTAKSNELSDTVKRLLGI
jgi:DNA-binding response OmpR family regulator